MRHSGSSTLTIYITVLLIIFFLNPLTVLGFSPVKNTNKSSVVSPKNKPRNLSLQRKQSGKSSPKVFRSSVTVTSPKKSEPRRPIKSSVRKKSYRKFYSKKRPSKSSPIKAYKAAVLMNANTGEILFKNNPREKLLPASLTKMMVTLVSIDAVRHGYVHLEDPVTVSEEARWVGGSRIYLRPGEILSLEELLEAVLIKSANDAAIAVAEHIGGTQENFVQMMNVYTHRLGMIDTFFVNVHGLPSPDGQDNISSAYDMAILARELIKSRKVLEWSSKPSTKIRSGRYKITTTNKLLKSFHGLDGLKTGYYRRAGFNIAATAKREDLRLIAVTMGSPSSRARFNATKTLLEAGFNYYQSKLNTPKKVDDVNKVNKPRKVPELKRTGEPKKIKESKKLKEPKGVKESKRLSGKTKGGRTNQVLNSLRGLT